MDLVRATLLLWTSGWGGILVPNTACHSQTDTSSFLFANTVSIAASFWKHQEGETWFQDPTLDRHQELRPWIVQIISVYVAHPTLNSRHPSLPHSQVASCLYFKWHVFSLSFICSWSANSQIHTFLYKRQMHVYHDLSFLSHLIWTRRACHYDYEICKLFCCCFSSGGIEPSASAW